MDDYSKLADHYHVPLPDGGTLYLSNRVTNKVKADYQSWLIGNARRDVFAGRPRLVGDKATDEAAQQNYEDDLASLTASSGAGTFSWGGPAFFKSMKQLPGLCRIICLLAEAGKKSELTDDQIYALIGQEGMATLLGRAVREICDSTPNFMSPPAPEPIIRTGKA